MKNELNMKKFIYIFTMLFAVVFSACNSEDLDYDIEYTSIHPIGGMYRVKIVDEAGAEVKLSSSMYCYLSNTNANDTDKCWIRIGNYNTAASNAYAINGKIACDVKSLTFSGTAMNLAGNVTSSNENFTITNGKIELKGATAPSGTVCDKISFTFTRDNFPGKTYTVTGYRYTGWTETD
jgi:hypothetical protein